MARAKYKQLDRDRRIQIEALFRAKLKPREIAEQIGCHVSTIYREFRRGEYEHLNSDYTTERRYSAEKAEAVHQINASAKGAPLKIGKNFAVAQFIEDKIRRDKYSPAAVCALLRTEEYAYFGITFCKHTIYKYIEDGNIFPNITNKDLPEKGERKREYKQVQEKKDPRGRSIEGRSEEANERKEPGHWEMDSVLGKKGTKARLLVLSERVTRNEIIIKIQDGRAITVVRAIDKLERAFGDLFPVIFKTITCDNGSEFANWAGIERSVWKRKGQRTTVYFCHPYTASERGTNENINRMIRRHFPKGTDFGKVTAAEVKRVERWINTYPREILGFATASDVFEEAFGLAS